MVGAIATAGAWYEKNGRPATPENALIQVRADQVEMWPLRARWCLRLLVPALRPPGPRRNEAAHHRDGRKQNCREIAVPMLVEGDRADRIGPEWKRQGRDEGVGEPGIALLAHVPDEQRREQETEDERTLRDRRDRDARHHRVLAAGLHGLLQDDVDENEERQHLARNIFGDP